ncbi:MAG: hypothetical protein ABI605_08370 [Rhizobacter sp.]
MDHHRLDDMIKGWFVGGFTPTALSTTACEVGLKTYPEGAFEGRHFHKVATEVTLVVSGRVRMAGREWGTGDVVVLAPGEATDFLALTEAVTVVVKVPGQLDDKFALEDGTA